MRLQLALLAASTILTGAGAASAATVEIKDAVVRVTVIPEARNDIKVEIVRANTRAPLGIRSLGDRTVIDGDLDRRIRSCRSAGAKSWAEVRGIGRIDWADMPQVVIHTPRDVKIDTGGAVFGAIGRSASLSLGNSGCGDWTIANVDGEARISQAGSGDTRMGSAGALRLRVAGSGDVAATDIRGPLDISIAGAGSTNIRSVAGPLDVSMAGSGDVTIEGGRASVMKVSIAGAGDVDFRGVADTLRARIAGSGNVHAGAVKGEVSKSVMGSGEVRVGS